MPSDKGTATIYDEGVPKPDYLKYEKPMAMYYKSNSSFPVWYEKKATSSGNANDVDASSSI